MWFHDFVSLDMNMLIPREGWTTGGRRCLCGAGFFGHFWHLFRLIRFGHVWCCEAIGHKFPEVSNCRGSVPACLLMHWRRFHTATMPRRFVPPTAECRCLTMSHLHLKGMPRKGAEGICLTHWMRSYP